MERHLTLVLLFGIVWLAYTTEHTDAHSQRMFMQTGQGPMAATAALTTPHDSTGLPAAVTLRVPVALRALSDEECTALVRQVVVPSEVQFFRADAIGGLDPKTGWPYDHVRIRLDGQLLAEIGKYTAASKASLSAPCLLHIMQRKSGFEHAGMTPQAARAGLRAMLKTFERFNQAHSECQGFVPWGEPRTSREGIHPSTNKLPSLDNGQLTWALAGIVGALAHSSDAQDRELAGLAQALLDRQQYGLFYDPASGQLYGTLQWDPHTQRWTGDPSYHLTDMYEGTMAVLWAVLHGQAPESAWDTLQIPTLEYVTAAGERITTLQGYRGSFHEHWALAFLPFMESRLAPLYRNFLFVQADYARRHGLPGFVATAYDSRGSYRQMGVPEIARQSVDRSDVAVTYATAMGMLIDPAAGAAWLQNLYRFPGLMTRYGAVESVGPDGYADIFSADAKGMTLLAATGGMQREIKQYLKQRTVPGTSVSMYDKLLMLLNRKYDQMMAQRGGQPLAMPTGPVPLPSERQIAACRTELSAAGETIHLTAHLQSGHQHGKNVRTIDRPTLEDDLRPGQPFSFAYDIPAFLDAEDQWAFRGTYLDTAVRMAEMRWLSLTIPADTPPMLFDIELKRDDTPLAVVPVNTAYPGTVITGKDGQPWKVLVLEVNPTVPESRYMPLNWVGVAMHNPDDRGGIFARHARQGRLIIDDLRLLTTHPLLPDRDALHANNKVPVVSGDVQLFENWSPRGPLSGRAIRTPRSTWYIPGGQGMWGWNYVPVRDLGKYRYINLKVRNVSEAPNQIFFEFKHNEQSLLDVPKVRVALPIDQAWHVVRVAVPRGRALPPINVIALSDPLDDVEVSSVGLGNY